MIHTMGYPFDAGQLGVFDLVSVGGEHARPQAEAGELGSGVMHTSAETPAIVYDVLHEMPYDQYVWCHTFEVL